MILCYIQEIPKKSQRWFSKCHDTPFICGLNFIVENACSCSEQCGPLQQCGFYSSETWMWAYSARCAQLETCWFSMWTYLHTRVKLTALLVPCFQYFNWSPSLLLFLHIVKLPFRMILKKCCFCGIVFSKWSYLIF